MQDEASMIAVSRLAPQKGENVLDVCSAPGGKSTYMAELMQNSGAVVSLDISGRRLAELDESSRRLGIRIIRKVVQDARDLSSLRDFQADRVLVDAPCSGLGVIRRKPEIKWAASPEEIPALSGLQQQILFASAACVKPGGILMYCTCTLSQPENEEVTSGFLRRSPAFRQVDSQKLFPDADGTDGFYFAVFRRDDAHAGG